MFHMQLEHNMRQQGIRQEAVVVYRPNEALFGCYGTNPPR
jgi:hypothetical protein